MPLRRFVGATALSQSPSSVFLFEEQTSYGTLPNSIRKTDDDWEARQCGSTGARWQTCLMSTCSQRANGIQELRCVPRAALDGLRLANHEDSATRSCGRLCQRLQLPRHSGACLNRAACGRNSSPSGPSSTPVQPCDGRTCAKIENLSASVW